MLVDRIPDETIAETQTIHPENQGALKVIYKWGGLLVKNRQTHLGAFGSMEGTANRGYGGKTT